MLQQLESPTAILCTMRSWRAECINKTPENLGKIFFKNLAGTNPE